MAVTKMNIEEFNASRNKVGIENKRKMTQSEVSEFRNKAKELSVPLETNDGKKFGNISYNAYRAIAGDYLDKYSPIDDNEKSVLDSFKEYIASLQPEVEPNQTVPMQQTASQKAYAKYAGNKESKIEGVNDNKTLLGGDTARFEAAPKKSAWEKTVDKVTDYFERVFAGSNAQRMYDEATGFKENRGAWTDDQIAQMAISALHKADEADWQDFAIVDEAYARLSRSTKYKDSDLVLALEEARKSWGASPLKAAGENVKAAVVGTVSDVASFANSLGADHVPVLKNVTNAAVEAGKDARQDAAAYNKGEYGEALGAVTQGVVNLLPYYFLGTGKAAASAASKAPKALAFLKTAAKNPSFWYSLSTMWGGKYQEALDGGASRSSALANAVLYSVPAALVEVSGGVGAQGQQGKKLSSTIFEEIREELVQDLISGAADKVTTKPDLPIFSMTEDAVINPVNMAKTAVMTAPIVAIGSGMSAGVSRMVNLTSQRIQLRKTTNDRKLINAITNFSDSVLKESLGISAEADTTLTKSQLGEIGKMYSSKESIEALVEDGLQSPEGSASHTAAMKIEAKLKGNQKISNVEIGTLVEANIRQIAAENAAVESTAAPVETPVESVSESVESAPSEDSPASVSVGDTFKDTATGNTVTVVDRNDETTTVEIDTGVKTETRELSNERADAFAASEQVEQVESSEADSEADSAAEAQKYNIVVSNLKRKAEELGLLDKDFFTALQNVNMYNPSAEDKALISREFGRVFAGNTDSLVTSWLNSIGATAQPVTSINDESMHDSTETAPADVSTADTGVELAEGEILSLKHTKNIYSLFKGSARVIVGKDVITDGFVAIPLTDEALAEVKKVADAVQENPNATLDKFYHKDNDVVIQGDAKIGEGKAGNKKVDAYVFKIGETFYSCQQKYIDAFNNGKNSIKANKDVRVPWTVHDENGNFVALFLGLNAATTEENYGAMRSVSEIKATEKQKKAENASKPFNKNEVGLLIDGTPYFFTRNGSNYVGEGHIYVRCDEAATAFIKDEYRKRHTDSNSEIEHKDELGARVEKIFSEAVELAEATEPISYSSPNGTNKTDNAYIIGEYAAVYDKNFVNLIKKRSSSMKVISSGSLGTTLLVGYDADGGVTGFALPIAAKGEVTTKDGRAIPFVSENDIKRIVKEAAKNAVETSEDVVETSENVDETSEDVVETSEDVVETTETVDNSTFKLTDKCELIATKHTASGDDIWVVTLKDRLSSDEYKDLSGKVKSVGGYYSRFAKTPEGKAIPGFVFKSEPTAKELSVFSDFFGYTENAESDNSKIVLDMDDDTRTAILNKKSVNVVSFDAEKTKTLDGVDFDTLQNSYPGYARPIIRKIARDFGIFNELFFNPDIELEFNYSGESIRESINKQHSRYGDFVKMLSVFSDVIENAVGVETHKDKYTGTRREDTDLKQMYVLASAFSDEKDIYPVKLEVKEFYKKTNKLYLSVVLTKKESRYLSGNLGQNQLSTAPPTFNISISDLVSIVNPSEGDFLKYFPDSMLDSEQIEGKNKALAKDAEKIEELKSQLKNQPEDAIIEENTDKEGVTNVESESEVLAEESKPDGGGLHAGTETPDAETGVEEPDRSPRNDSREGLPESVGADGIGSDVGNDSEGVYGTDDVADTSGETDGNSAEIDDGEPETIDTEVKTVEKKRPSNKDNYIITDDVAAEFDSTSPSAKDNIEAIELLLTLESEGRAATAEEKKILAKYKGWGGIDTRYMPYELSSRFSNLFDLEQRKSLQSSQNNAFFTPTKVIDAMYEGLKRMGFKGGNVLESSMGVGNFFGRMPAVMTAKSALTGVELESYTARIAQYLYPGATVINMPFQDVAIKNGSYDLVIGNVPFGQNKISYNKKKYSLHNYFIISSLDKVRDGGIVAVITSAGTLESHSIDARSAIMDRADVVACYKLPEKVFSRNASTDVQTDLLILRKRGSGEKPKGDSILNTTTTADGLRVNEYFVKHPENVLGTLAKGTNAWGEVTTVLDNGDFYDKLNAAMKKLPKDLITGKADLKPVETIVSLSDKPRFFEKNGKVYADDGAGTATEVSKNQTNTVRDYIAVRDAYKALLGAYENDLSDEAIKPLRDSLSKAYDNFYKNHGAITGDGKKKIGTKKSTNNTFLEADADYYLVSGLERYDAKNNTFTKSALFEKDTLRKKRVTSVDSSSDALAISLNESGRIDFDRMQELTGKTEKQLAEDLKGEIVLTPEGDYVLTDIYLSGNIYEKLEAVKGKPEFKEQQEMLEKVIPTPKGASDITVKLGANYIDSSYVEAFAREILNTRLAIKKDISGRWVIEGVKQARYGDVVNVKYGCAAFNAVQILEKILNDGEITATKKVGEGRDAVTVFDAEMTDIARQKADDIRDAFESWIFADSDRRTEIVDKYNRTYNNYRPLDYERIAEKLSFDSMDETLKSKLYPHQKKGIARFLFGGNILFAHGVGTGKTFEMIASVMEAKRMGIINKAAMVVPNNKVVDFKNDIAQAYPNAKVLVIDTANKKRQTMLGLVNSNDWDIVLIARTTFTRIPVSRELQAHYAAQQLEDLDIQIAEAQSDRNITKRQMKSLITQRDNLEQKLKDLNSDTARDENSVDFEKLGIDCICVDEAHNYKSIITPTKLDIKGLVNRNNAQLANDMLMKLDYLRSIDGKIIFGTGTPITNTVSEIYNMMRMVRPDVLEDAGIHSLDEWVNTFAKIETTTEIGIDNQIKNKSTQIIRSFINVSEMIGMFRQFADIVFTTDVVKNLPKAVYTDVELDGTTEHKQIEQQISSVIATTQKSDLLKVYGQLMSMADAASVDLRMLSGAESDHNIFKDYSPEELDYDNSKINVMCDNVYKEYTASNKIKGTQIIFCDKGSGSGTVYSFNLHKDIVKKLVERGIPEEQIVIVKNQSDAQLEALYDKVNAGEVRVLIGTSQKMAEGLNVQKRVVAIHHPTVTYKPSDKEQGDARGVRAGNINDEVHIYRYLQKNTFDSHKWQAQDRKGEMINKALRGELVAEMEDIGADEEGGAGVDAATAMAITSGNPLVKEKIDIDKEVKRLKTLQRNYLSEVYRYQDAISKNPGLIRQLTTYTENLVKDIALRNKHGEKSAIVIKDKSYEKQNDANKALLDAVKTAPKNGQFVKLGTYKGFDIMFKGDTGGMNYTLILSGSNKYNVEYAGSGNNIARFAGALNRLDAELDRVSGKLEALKKDLEFAKQEVAKPFEKEKELTEALEKQKDITYRYEHFNDNTKTPEAAETVEDEVIDAESETEEHTYIAQGSTDASDSVKSVKPLANPVENVWVDEDATTKPDMNKVPTLSELIKEIGDAFGITIKSGKVMVRDATGVYKAKPEVIRTRGANQLPIIIHELGHHFNKKYGIEKSAHINEAETLLNIDKSKYSANELPGEMAAEFVRRYFKNPEAIKQKCPNLTADFLGMLSKQDAKAVSTIAPKVNAFMSAEVGDLYSKTIIDSKTAKRLDKADLDDKAHELYTKWIDGFHPIKQLTEFVEESVGRTVTGAKNAYKLATNSLNAHNIANFVLLKKFRNLNGEVLSGNKSFVECVKGLDLANDKTRTAFSEYLKLKHALEVQAKGKDVFPNEIYSDENNINARLNQLETTHPDFEAAAKNLYDFQYNILTEFAVKAGLMTQEEADFLHSEYPCYVPFYRYMKGKKGSFARKSIANQKSPIMRMKGSGLDTLDPLENIVQNTERIIAASIKHQTADLIGKYADTVDGIGAFIERVPPDKVAETVGIAEQKEQFKEKLKGIAKSSADYFAVSDLLDDVFGDAVTGYSPVANPKNRIIVVHRGGERAYYQVHNEALFESITELTPKQASGTLSVIASAMGKTNALITQFNPGFATSNPIRDIMTAYDLGNIDNPVEFIKAYTKSLAFTLTKNDMYTQFKAMGGGHSSRLNADLGEITKSVKDLQMQDKGLARRAVYAITHHPIQLLTAFSDFTESIPRFMVFMDTYNKTGDLQEAMYQADDITTNFKRRGSGATAKVVNSTFRFNNAALQGLDKTRRTFTDASGKRVVQISAKWLTTAIIGALIRSFFNRWNDEEGYENLSSYKKNNFYNFALGDGYFISLPKERENAVLDSLVERTVDAMCGEDDAFYDFGGYLASQLLPPMLPSTINPIDAVHELLNSTIIGPFTDIGFNKDFKGTPIESEYDKYLPSNERYNDSTSKLAYNLGQTKLARDADMSPKKIDHLLSAFGILSTVNDALFPANDNRRDVTLGLRNRFVTDSNYSTDVLNVVYDNRDKTEKVFIYDSTADNAVEYEKNAIMADYISGMNKAIKALPEEEQRKGRAYLLKNLNSWNYGNTATQSSMVSHLADSAVSRDCVFDSMPSSVLEWTVDGQKYVYQMSPQEYHTYITNHLTVIENARKHYGGNSVESYEAAKTAAKKYMSDYKSTTLKSQYLGKATPVTK